MAEDNYQYFMQTDLADYSGEWIAICNKKIVSHNIDVKKVFSEAKKKCPDSRPLLTRVPTEETMIFWLIFKMPLNYKYKQIKRPDGTELTVSAKSSTQPSELVPIVESFLKATAPSGG